MPKQMNLPISRQHVTVGAAIDGIGAYSDDEQRAEHQRPERREPLACYGPLWRGGFSFCCHCLSDLTRQSSAFVVTEDAAREDADGDHDGHEHQELADDGVVLVGEQRFALTNEERAGRNAK